MPKYYEYHHTPYQFQCIDISRYYTGDWAQVIQYVFRWEHKNGISDLNKAIAFAQDAITHHDNTPKPNHGKRTPEGKQAANLLTILEHANHAQASVVWQLIREQHPGQQIIQAIQHIINQHDTHTDLTFNT